MVVDTQEIIERAHLGDMDYVKHALTLFTDFVGVFVRLLIIMVSYDVRNLIFRPHVPLSFLFSFFRKYLKGIGYMYEILLY